MKTCDVTSSAVSRVATRKRTYRYTVVRWSVYHSAKSGGRSVSGAGASGVTRTALDTSPSSRSSSRVFIAVRYAPLPPPLHPMARVKPMPEKTLFPTGVSGFRRAPHPPRPSPWHSPESSWRRSARGPSHSVRTSPVEPIRRPGWRHRGAHRPDTHTRTKVPRGEPALPSSGRAIQAMTGIPSSALHRVGRRSPT